ncbi:hypothetical protein Hamer_G011103 [Homarus americanus]|uniref:Secreted protein n=1 Tax=Homarus americanus TaxID=6706 RepID=A0A8J5K2F8_HOMAM|nr:hypothetical protein Hamer_G011103 [Homarus americanus]
MFMRVALAAAVVMVVVAAPSNKEGRESSQLPAEHRKGTPSSTPHPMEDIVDAVLTSETMAAVDEAAARVTTAIGGVIDDLGNFVVNSVKELPDAIREVSEKVNQAIAEGGEQVVIIVKGVKTKVTNGTATRTVTNTVDRVFQVANSSQTASSFKDLRKFDLPM